MCACSVEDLAGPETLPANNVLTAHAHSFLYICTGHVLIVSAYLQIIPGAQRKTCLIVRISLRASRTPL